MMAFASIRITRSHGTNSLGLPQPVADEDPGRLRIGLGEPKHQIGELTDLELRARHGHAAVEQLGEEDEAMVARPAASAAERRT